ncbi:MAG: AhpC/TSA family protein [Actinomycetota bacterium]
MSRKHEQQHAFGDAVVVLVTFTSVPELRRYVQWTDLRIPALVDPDRTSYRAYGIGSASALRVWGFKNLKRYLRIFAGRKLTAIRRPTEDTRQLGADMVIDRDGNLAWAHWPDGPDDRPTMQQLVDAVRACG